VGAAKRAWEPQRAGRPVEPFPEGAGLPWREGRGVACRARWRKAGSAPPLRRTKASGVAVRRRSRGLDGHGRQV